MKKKKIAVIGTRGIPATYSGIERHCEDLYSILSNNNYEVTVYGRNYCIPEGMNEYKSIKIKRIPIFHISGLETFIHSFISTIVACFSDADIIHFHAQGPCIFSWIPRIFCPWKKIVFTCHGIDWQRDKWSFIAKTVIQLGELASAIFPHKKICVSEELSKYYSKKYNVSTEKIVNGVEIKEKIPLQNCGEKFNLSKDKYVVFVGRMVPEKAIDNLVKAYKLTNTDIKLVLIGGEAGTQSYFQELKDLGQDDERIIFTDFIYGNEIQELYSNALCYISASKLEGLPITVLEAMSYGLPVVLSDIPPHNEILQLNNKIGISFKSNNIEECKKAIEEIITKSQDEISEMGQNSLNTVKEHFNWDKIASMTDQLYKNM